MHILFFQKILKRTKKKKNIPARVAYALSLLAELLFLLMFLPTGEQTRLNRSCASSICQNGGVCSFDVGAGTHFCQCTVNYQGRFCETRKRILEEQEDKNINRQIMWYWTVYFSDWENSMAAALAGMQDKAAIKREVDEHLVIQLSPVRSECLALTELLTTFTWMRKGESFIAYRAEFRYW